MDHDELVRKYRTDPDTLSPEVREKTDAALEWLRERRRRGDEVIMGKPGDNFPIGLDDNLDPFPARRERRTGSDASGDAASEQ
ncbi:hypothetical protein [Saccharopolyspora hattusasensis]|uniref:hypothetical protein n=1 Tax=Saccharopolyspora hattusasensis TaxID=1128679 RepID=UPI003D98F781